MSMTSRQQIIVSKWKKGREIFNLKPQLIGLLGVNIVFAFENEFELNTYDAKLLIPNISIFLLIRKSIYLHC